METEGQSVDLVGASVVRPFARAAILAALMGATALVAIPYPLSPAPVTLQILVVFLVGLYLGPYWGGFSMVLYLTAGAAGAPIFSHGNAGVGYLFAETGGFLWSFPLAVVLVGLFVHGTHGLRDPGEVSLPVIAVALTCAMVLMYAAGTAYYAWLIGIGLVEAAFVMAIPFVPADLLKMAAAVAIVRAGVIDPT
ncbi:biotin transporter BioY [Natronobiforma cellulositropha]|uniref:biotin transporter BioY n=1 Tax=Natronobiforma cellulositropha TaxID=1679076 RepID=UPI0021D57BE0|nr:biotin transporter BioY [Natronobiforma cellulositropha]